jgi:histidine triad (HIT) family protein
MFNHEPAGYTCPLCVVVTDQRAAGVWSELVRRTDHATAIICPRWWPGNAGHVLVLPNRHYENVYDLPAEDAHAVFDLTRDTAIAMRHAYRCHGVTIHQHNEPAGDQSVWHLHVHVVPRYVGDTFYGDRPRPVPAPAARRREYARRLRAHFG